jgi:hypothetical protein
VARVKLLRILEQLAHDGLERSRGQPQGGLVRLGGLVERHPAQA